MDVDVAALGMHQTSETYEHIGTVPVWVHDLGHRWQEEEARTRVIVDERHTAFQLDTSTSSPPQVAWEFVTTPGRRVTWQPGVIGVEVTATGNRRGAGATNHCLHGKDAVVEELLDWRPYDYFTMRNTVPTPLGPVRFLQTTEFEPTASGTNVHMRFAAPRTRKERAIMEQVGDALVDRLRTAATQLAEQLDADLARRGPDATEEPDLPRPRPDGVLADLAPEP